MSTITWNSLLLSKGSIFTRTSLKNTSEQATSSRSTMAARKTARRFQSRISGAMMRRYSRVVQSSVDSSRAAAGRSSRVAAHGETMKAMKSENSMATDAPTGMGRMYGPMSPLTKAMGRMAAITAKVARMVGLPTSSTASTATAARARPRFCGRWMWRAMFSTTTMASSTRIPIEKMSAKSVTRFSV
jgi:hypothetical protein